MKKSKNNTMTYSGQEQDLLYMPLPEFDSFDNDRAVRGKVGRMIDSVYVNETKKTTTVKFVDGSVQTVSCHPDDVFDPVIGVAIAVSSFVFGSKKNFHDVVSRKIKKSTKSSN